MGRGDLGASGRQRGTRGAPCTGNFGVSDLHPGALRRGQGKAEWGSGALGGHGLSQGVAPISKPLGDTEQVGRVWRGALGMLGTRYSHEVPRGGNTAVPASPDPKKLLKLLQTDMSGAGPSDAKPRAGIGISTALFASQ